MKGLFCGAVVALLIALCGFDSALAGPEFRANTTITNDQNYPSIARLSDGGFVVVWCSVFDQHVNVFARRYDSGGTAVGDEFLVTVNSVPNESKYGPMVAGLSNGGFLVVWLSDIPTGPRTHIVTSVGRIYRADGTLAKDDFQISQEPTHVAVASLAEGGFIAVYVSGGGVFVSAKRYTDLGELTTQGTPDNANPFTVATYPIGSSLTDPRVAGLASGGFVVIWTAYDDGGVPRVFRATFDGQGLKHGNNEAIAADGINQFVLPAVSASIAGYMIAWVGNINSVSGIYGQTFNASGSQMSEPLRLDDSSSTQNTTPSVAGLDNGGYAVAWAKDSDGSGLGIFGQIFDRLGKRVAGPRRINSYTAGDQSNPLIAALEGRGLAAVWVSSMQDGSGDGIYGRVLSFGSRSSASNPGLQ